MTHLIQESERASFEAWRSDNGKWPKAVERDRHGSYMLLATAMLWDCWQAARASLPAPTGWQLVPAGQTSDRDRLLKALERACRAETALRRLADECDNDTTPGWEERMTSCIAWANHVLSGKCDSCGGTGWLGGPTYQDPGEGGEPCMDCVPRTATRHETTGLIVRGCCESEPVDPEHPDTICINVLDLEAIVALHIGSLTLAEDPPAAPSQEGREG